LTLLHSSFQLAIRTCCFPFSSCACIQATPPTSNQLQLQTAQLIETCAPLSTQSDSPVLLFPLPSTISFPRSINIVELHLARNTTSINPARPSVLQRSHHPIG
jgi:hypothetical protein